MSDEKWFEGGLPYGPTIAKLEQIYPVPSLNEGRLISHDELEGVVGEKRGTQRYYGVINGWLKKQRTYNGIYIVWEQGEGVRVLDPAGLLAHAETKTQQKLRQTGHAVKIYAHVDRDRLDETGQRRLDHQMRVARVVGEALIKARKDFAVELAPVVSLPKRQIAG